MLYHKPAPLFLAKGRFWESPTLWHVNQCCPLGKIEGSVWNIPFTIIHLFTDCWMVRNHLFSSTKQWEKDSGKPMSWNCWTKQYLWVCSSEQQYQIQAKVVSIKDAEIFFSVLAIADHGEGPTCSNQHRGHWGPRKSALVQRLGTQPYSMQPISTNVSFLGWKHGNTSESGSNIALIRSTSLKMEDTLKWWLKHEAPDVEAMTQFDVPWARSL